MILQIVSLQNVAWTFSNKVNPKYTFAPTGENDNVRQSFYKTVYNVYMALYLWGYVFLFTNTVAVLAKSYDFSNNTQATHFNSYIFNVFYPWADMYSLYFMLTQVLNNFNN